MDVGVEAGTAAAIRGAARRVTLHLVAPLALGALLLLLDRTAMGYQAHRVGAALGLSAVQVGFATPILFLGILLFEVPSAMAAGRVGAQRWLTALLVVWGGASLATACATGPGTFYAARIVASVAQAGYLPVALFLLARFVPAGHRTRAFAWMVLMGLLAAVLGPLLATQAGRLGGAPGLTGWRWMFGGLGLGCLALAGVVAARLPDRPEDAAWLDAAAKDALAWSRSVEPRGARLAPGLAGLFDPRLLVLAGIGFALSLSSFAAGTWYAALMRDRHAPVGAAEVVFVVAIAATVLLWSRRVDRATNKRDAVAQGLVLSLGLATVAYAAGVFPGPVIAKLAGLAAHAATAAAAGAMIWSVASRMVTAGGGGGAACMAVIDAAGLVGAFLAPRLVAGLAQQAQSLQAGLLALVLALVAATGGAVLLRGMLLRD